MSYNQGIKTINATTTGVADGQCSLSRHKSSPHIETVSHGKLQFLAVPLLILNDVAAFYFSILIAYAIRALLLPVIIKTFPQIFLLMVFNTLWWVPALACIFFIFEKSYTKRLPFWQEAGHIVKTTTLVFLVAICIVFLAKLGDTTSRTLVLVAWTISLFVVPTFRYLGKLLLVKLHIWEKPVIIVGAGETGKLILKAIQCQPTIGYKPVGFLDDDKVKQLHPPELPSGQKVPVLGNFDEAETVMEHTGVYDVIVAAPGLQGKNLVQLVNRLQRKANNLLVVPDLFGMAMEGVDVQYLFDERTLVLGIKNNLNDKLNVTIKRVFDLLTGMLIFIGLLPFMVLIAILIKLESNGPVIFAHRRVGKDGIEFNCLKFRTMVSNAQQVLEELLDNDPESREEWNRDFKLKNDPRVTRIGKLLRKTSLDELPQIINVLMGQMSLVGPRPIVKDEIIKYGSRINYYYQVPPGITGLWQVSGRSDIDYKTRVQIDTWYVRNWSLWLDITLLIRTINVVLARKGAY
ncbi:undecaprenyl-phosphate galactose phosphotransferase WbaP [Desulfoscipio geothermicus]|uniref:Undecaprenyl-phosphate galactose phosphotransferase n=1 Tax=Desulfoscipio geothermicus DSM 3669 TaxID=1121426 RepID=A0A1I6E8W9_9FIRM|nr:undecaprenyl-phosphate galactose phosphotransferase WbaP [Desulfoscipio geothermicus]SFR14156.1 undecaprenyl-phosphate galactose phosphotransferase [Desulfoscipio geothermicus DSM 3669]